VKLTRDYVIVRFRDVHPPPGGDGKLFRCGQHSLLPAHEDADFVIAAYKRSPTSSGPTPDETMAKFLRALPAEFEDKGFERLENSYKRDAQRLFERILGLPEDGACSRAGDARELARRAERVLSHHEVGHKHSPLPHR
jgi:hypothetical protein